MRMNFHLEITAVVCQYLPLVLSRMVTLIIPLNASLLAGCLLKFGVYCYGARDRRVIESSP